MAANGLEAAERLAGPRARDILGRNEKFSEAGRICSSILNLTSDNQLNVTIDRTGRQLLSRLQFDKLEADYKHLLDSRSIDADGITARQMEINRVQQQLDQCKFNRRLDDDPPMG
jgi:hypothetical protein